ncbi:MAG: hypothetical protein AB7O97_13975 [Planctomycetota bacterium]
MTPEPAVTARGDRVRALAAAAAALAVFLLMAQNIVHGFDVFDYLKKIDGGDWRHSRMVLYLPLAIAWCRAFEWLGVDAYAALRALSSVGAAVGVGYAWLAARRLGLCRHRATLVAAGCVAVPSALYTASVAEVDALLFGLACAAWLPFARLVTGGGARAAALTGLVTGASAGFHAAGHLLAGALTALNLGWGWPGRGPRRTLPLSGVLAATHLLVSIGVALLGGATQQGEMVTNTVHHAFHADFVGHVLWHEWLLPYLPFALLWLVALRSRADRGAALAFAACLLGYLYLTTLILGYQRSAKDFLAQGNIVERGTFLLGLVPPMLLLALRTTPRALGWTAVAAGLLSGGVQIRLRDWPADPPGYGAGCAELQRRQAMTLFLADVHEQAWIARRAPGIPVRLLGEPLLQARLVREQLGADLDPAFYVLWFDLEYDMARAGGRDYVITGRALHAMEQCADPGFVAAVPLLRQRYEFEPLHADSFDGWRLRRR